MTAVAELARPTVTGLTGTTSLLRLAARRDRVLVPVSALGLAGFVAMSAQATFALFPDLRSAQASMAPTLANPALVAMYGPISAADADAPGGSTVVGLDWVGRLLGAHGRVLPMAAVPLDIVAEVRGADLDPHRLTELSYLFKETNT